MEVERVEDEVSRRGGGELRVPLFDDVSRRGLPKEPLEDVSRRG